METTSADTNAVFPLPTTQSSANIISDVPLPRLPSGQVDVVAWAKQSGVEPVQDFEELSAEVWPADESADDFLAARREWRREGTARTNP